MWDEGEWRHMKATMPDFEERSGYFSGELMGFIIEPTEEQSKLGIYRPWAYISASVTEANRDEEVTMKIIKDILDFIDTTKKFQ
ncbi:hypothetical protein F4779DRAFT_567185 [Xylariaceae sp. FL0662B]|nr:hypothetical protein F4779DRAFT_567185 [Xylariaceae sp. FL0662B]